MRAHPPEVSAAKARRWGAFYYAEQVLRVMKGYGWSIFLYSVGQPAAYLFAMGVGLATLVDTNAVSAFGGVSYIAFIAPALLVSAAVMTAATEFTFPVMDGFKWRRVYYGPHASPLTPEQIAAGQIIAVTLRFLLQSVIYFVIVALFGASPSGWGWGSVLVATLAGLSFGLPLMAYAAIHQGGQGPVRHGDAVHRHAAVPVLRHVLPAGHAARAGPLDRLDLAHLARHGAGPGDDLRLRGIPGADHHPCRVPAGLWPGSAGCSPSANSSGGWGSDSPDPGPQPSPRKPGTGASARCTRATPAR